nr:uncharacterized protein LOC113819134 [Penaeus vannamei]
MDVRVHGVGPASDTVPKLVTVLEIGDRRPRATGPCGEPEMDSFADTAASGLLLSKHPVVYNNMLCKVENPKDVSDSSPSVTPSLTCDSPVTQLSPPVNMTSEHVSPSEHGIKDDVSTYAAPAPAITKMPSDAILIQNQMSSTGSVCTGNMNQMCKVCGEPAAGFHFGAFTCEGCKSFFGRTYNNIPSPNECKNSGRCVINKKTRTSCKSCRLRKCLRVGMSKSGSRYGRRSNWFKIHYLMQNNSSATSSADDPAASEASAPTATSTTTSPGLISPSSESMALSPDLKDFKDFKDFKLSPDFKLNSDFKAVLECKGLNSPSSSESHNSDSSLDLSEKSLFPPYSEHLYPKDLLALYNLPTLTPRLPPYVAPTTLAHRYLYPYYPFLSVYSRKQYLDTLMQEARQRGVATPVDGEDEPGDGGSPPPATSRRRQVLQAQPLADARPQAAGAGAPEPRSGPQPAALPPEPAGAGHPQLGAQPGPRPVAQRKPRPADRRRHGPAGPAHRPERQEQVAVAAAARVRRRALGLQLAPGRAGGRQREQGGRRGPGRQEEGGAGRAARSQRREDGVAGARDRRPAVLQVPRGRKRRAARRCHPTMPLPLRAPVRRVPRPLRPSTKRKDFSAKERNAAAEVPSDRSVHIYSINI